MKIMPDSTRPTAYRSARFVITLDGPAASGKTSAAKALATHLGIAFVSSGLLYRAATYLCVQQGVDVSDEAAVLGCVQRHNVVLMPEVGSDNRVHIDGDDISAALHTDHIDAHVSAVAQHPQLRAWVDQRLQALHGYFVVEGRDMGSTVFPNADYKFYLQASAAVRARRRLDERASQGDLHSMTEAIRRRDQRDAKQLLPAADAINLDTSELSPPQVLAQLLSHLRPEHRLLEPNRAP